MKKFTLIELLIIIGILAILTTLLLPSISKAKDRAYAAVCASNQAQIYRGSLTWTKKQNGWLPFGWRKDKHKFAYGLTWGVGTDSANNEKPIALGWVIKDQVLTAGETFYCPKGPYELNESAWESLLAQNYTNSNRVRIDYTMNPDVQNIKPGDEPTLEFGSKMLITQIDQRAVMTETVNWGIPHNRFAITTFSDGHVKFIATPLLNQNGMGNSASDWRNLWEYFDNQF
ncbi:MAG: hypothetical protein NE330_05510 [Lentisphaeraceae bacterium]|nr:hypothetical protein [Lentisphaeraceae bacterium]